MVSGTGWTQSNSRGTGVCTHISSVKDQAGPSTAVGHTHTQTKTHTHTPSARSMLSAGLPHGVIRSRKRFSIYFRKKLQNSCTLIYWANTVDVINPLQTNRCEKTLTGCNGLGFHLRDHCKITSSNGVWGCCHVSLIFKNKCGRRFVFQLGLLKIHLDDWGWEVEVVCDTCLTQNLTRKKALCGPFSKSSFRPPFFSGNLS